MEFAYPWVLWLLLLLPPLWWALGRWSRPGAVRVPWTAAFAGLPGSWRLRLRRLPDFLRLLALALLLLALARPREGREKVIENRRGVAMEMVLDRSGSMGEPFIFRGQKVDRLAAAKTVFRDFVMGGGGEKMAGRPHDLVGMVTFARYADTMCPLTLAHEVLPQTLETVVLADSQAEDGTAIGDALALAAARLYNAEKELDKRGALAGKSARAGNYTIKSKIIILLTDGDDNCSRTPPAEAVKLCRKWGIKIYAVAVGGGARYINTPLGRVPIDRAPVDVGLLKKLAADTDGRFFLAGDDADVRNAEKGGVVKSLQDIYAEIDKLEKTEIEAVRYADYAERFMPLALAALGCLLLERLLRQTLLRVNS